MCTSEIQEKNRLGVGVASSARSQSPKSSPELHKCQILFTDRIMTGNRGDSLRVRSAGELKGRKQTGPIHPATHVSLILAIFVTTCGGNVINSVNLQN